jgi:hypothetical protein
MGVPMPLRMPPDSPEKWRAVQSALETAAKTRRLCAILLLDNLSIGVILVAAIVLVLLWH